VASLTKRCPVDSQLPGPSPGAPTSFDVEAVLREWGSEPGGSSARIGCVVLGVGAEGQCGRLYVCVCVCVCVRVCLCTASRRGHRHAAVLTTHTHTSAVLLGPPVPALSHLVPRVTAHGA